MYAELKSKSNYTFLTGASAPEELVHRAHQVGLVALGINDLNGVYALPKAYWAAKDIPQLKLICGAEVVFNDNLPPLTFLATERRSYATLCRILTAAHAGKDKGQAFLTFDELQNFYTHDGFKNLVCLSPPQGKLEALKDLFQKNIYLEFSRFNDGLDSARTEHLLETHYKYDLPYVATNDVLYHDKGRRPLQDCFTSIRLGKPLNKAGFELKCNAERYLKSPFEMRLLFKDFPEATKNTLKIADQCTFSMSELKYRYPSEWIPQSHTAQSYLQELCLKGAREKYGATMPSAVHKQLFHELDLIRTLNFADYFLTIYDIVAFARSQDILCQGRGSAANSVVCYCLGITAIDPIQMNLLFERFISLERNEPPDIDVDFEHERREEVIQYIYKKYGRDRAGMVSAVVTYQKRSALRELSKAFGIDVGTLSAKKIERQFDELVKTSFDPNCRDKIDQLADEMNNFPRHISIHSGGFTLSADPIIDIVPVEPARRDGRTIIQWDKYDLDYLGLLKIDVLALGMLSAIKKTLDLVQLKLHEIPHDDAATYKMIQRADTVGTFQVESRAQMNMSGRLLPKNFYDLVVQIAIVRPGPIVGNMVHPYLKRRRGLEVAEYPHPKLREILGKTLGVPLFQEQLMKVAIEFGKFTPGEADYFRRAISAWRSNGNIVKIAEKLLEGMLKEGIPESYAVNFIEHMKGFGHYGFPESHSASFALISYASCYLKKHYPAEFACGLLNSQPMGFYAPHSLVDDAKNHGVKVLPVDPNHSQWLSTMEAKNTIRLGYNRVHGLSQEEAEEIISHRPYTQMSQFLAKNHIRADVLMRLAMGDGFKCFGEDQRHSLWRILDEKIKTQEQMDLFAGVHQGEQTHLFEGLSDFEAVRHDYKTYGLSTKNHPMVPLRKMLKLPPLTTYAAKRVKPGTFVNCSGLILVRQRPPTANGTSFSAIEDEHGFLDMVIFKNVYEKCKEIYLNNCFLIVKGFIERDGHTVTLKVTDMAPIFKDAATFNIEPDQYFY
ncbi:MAG: error-prone DNA polymerase [Bdellovibrionales bacterium]|nr:error-prone DNA polymerase [Bdellovibrionales bacterium]